MDAFASSTLTVQNPTYVMVTSYILIYDHLLSLGSEVKLIWPTKLSSPKVLFLFIRYMVPTVMTVFTIQLSGLARWELTDSVSLSCIGWMSFGAFMAFSTVATTNFLVLLRLWVIWDRNRKLVIWSLFFFIVTQLGGIATTSYLVWTVKQSLYWVPALRMCGFRGRPLVALIWAPGTAFEILLCAITWWNAFTQPRTANAPLATVMYRDGFLYFLVSLRIINTILAAAAPPGLIFVAMFPIWCATTTTTCRLIIKLRHIDHNDIDCLSTQDMSVAVHEEYDELVRSGVHVEMLRSVGPSTPVRSSRSGWNASGSVE
ncbi:hypothetical protein B0H19DRAFT_1094525 [Mycena capillaripes]|nr:hypothetical protein B0H19DRAFT_1094525 [Mycena capillaripes]